MHDDIITGLPKNNIGQLKSLIPSDDIITPEVLTLLRDGDSDSYQKVYLHWRKPIYIFTRNLVGSDSEADDITQDIFAALWENREKIDPSRNVRSLLFLIARRTAYNSYRARQTREKYAGSVWAEEGDYFTSHDIIVEREAELLKRAVLKNMPAQQRRIFEMSYDEGLSPEQIANELNIKRETVYSQLSIARKKISDAILVFLILFAASVPDDSAIGIVNSIIN